MILNQVDTCEWLALFYELNFYEVTFDLFAIITASLTNYYRVREIQMSVQ